MSVRSSTGDIRDNILFFAMARNLKDGPGFYLWIAKLWEFDFALTVKYMRSNQHRFNDASLATYNDLLTVNGHTGHVIVRGARP